MGSPAKVRQAGRHGAGSDERHATIMRRFYMALASYVLWTTITLIAWSGGMIALSLDIMLALVAGVMICNAGFWYVLHSGRSMTFRDPSMTKAQVIVGLFWLLVIIGASQADRSLMMVVYTVIMLFGIFRLDRDEFLSLTALALAGYVAVVAADLAIRGEPIDLFAEAIRFLVLASGLLWCAFFGSHVAQLRAALRRQNEVLRQHVKDAQRSADRDHLTSAYNRRYIMQALEQEHARLDHRQAPFAVIIFDLDHFKKINDRHGHIAGDRVLSRFVQLARRELRSADVVSPGRRRHAFGRFGGEEFIALLPETGLTGARQCAERLRAATAQEPFLHGVKVTCSAGIAVHRYGDTIEQTLSRADAALYRAKHSGRNCVHEAGATDKADRVVRLAVRE